ncbi:unnamed protein product, partial [Didymodactylos carnosus]
LTQEPPPETSTLILDKLADSNATESTSVFSETSESGRCHSHCIANLVYYRNQKLSSENVTPMPPQTDVTTGESSNDLQGKTNISTLAEEQTSGEPSIKQKSSEVIEGREANFLLSSAGSGLIISLF